MNRKVTLLLIAAVTAVLPAVAVADVMITGNIVVQGTQNDPVFVIQPGPNFLTANATGAIGWTTGGMQVEGQAAPMATFDLEGISNQTTALANVLDLNVTINAGVSGVLYVNFSADFPTGTLVFITVNPLTTTQVMSGAGGQSINSASFVYTGPFPGGTTTYYISFLLPPSAAYAGSSGTITGTFVAS